MISILRSVPGRSLLIAGSLTAMLASSPCAAEDACGEWTAGLFATPGLDDDVQAAAAFDDGSGPALYVGGQFVTDGVESLSRIARWNGTALSPLGSGTNATVRELFVHDDGTGPALYAGGGFTQAGDVAANGVARWNGSRWSALGNGVDGMVLALATFDDGTGPALFAGGRFRTSSGERVNYLAKWSGSAWLPLAGGANGPVHALAVYDDGTGPALFAGGEFTTIGGISARHVARWNGAAWSGVGGGLADDVNALITFDDGAGSALYAGGLHVGSRWDGNTWTSIQRIGLNKFAIHDDGSGPALYSAGFASVARWNGVDWSALSSNTNGEARTIASCPEAGRNVLFAGGRFVGVNQPVTEAHYIARWDGQSWSAVTRGITGKVHALATFDDGTGTALYVGGDFSSGTAMALNDVARWNGSNWASLGGGMDGDVRALAVFDDGTGPALFAGGYFTMAGGVPASDIARWNGTSWSPLSSGMNGPVDTLVVHDDGTGPALYAGGSFGLAGGVRAIFIARWNGSAWSALSPGGTIASGVGTQVLALRSFDDGSGSALFAGGHFATVGGVPMSNLARWTRNGWSPVGAGVGSNSSGVVDSFAAFDDGSGPALYVGGGFTTAGGVEAQALARWNGTGFSVVGDASDPSRPTGIGALSVFDDGSGAALNAGGFAAYEFVVTRWNGVAWSELGDAFNGNASSLGVSALGAFDDGKGPALYVGGSFTRIGTAVAGNLARWEGTASVRRGNVNAGAGSIADVLFVNRTAGDARRVVNTAVGSPLEVHLDAAPAGSVGGQYVLWMWNGEPRNCVALERRGTRLGLVANPTPLHAGQLPQPVQCVGGGRSNGMRCGAARSRPGPPIAPWTLRSSAGLGSARVVTLQGVIRDVGSANRMGASVTNAIILRVN
ncbi:MAG: hypothetical protein HY292_18930 [Planctomycetes bacterium]|nr:hypothetical protein [Planctomycetota bacterium]